MKPSEGRNRAAVLGPLADIFDTDPATACVNLAKARHAEFSLMKGVGTTGTATVTVEACTDAAGSGATAIAFNYRKATSGNLDVLGALTAATSSGFATTAGSTQQYVIGIDARELPTGSPFVRLKFVEVVNSPCLGVVSVVVDGPLFGGQTLTTVLA